MKRNSQDIDEKRVIEAALFISGRELSLEELRKLTGIGAMGYLKKMMETLVNEYEERKSSLEVINVDGKYVMRVRNEYLERVKQFAQEAEIGRSALRTLAFISKHNGILKSELVKKIGPQIYEDVKELVGNGFVRQQKAGRSSKLTVTEKFRKYFSEVAATAATPQEPAQAQPAEMPPAPAEEFDETEKMGE